MRRITTLLFLLTLGFAFNSNAQQIDIEKYREVSIEKWKDSMEEFAKKNASEKHPADSILFCGSSSIRIWNEIAEDIAPYHPIHRGFGGSKWSDVAVHADQLIKPHQFRAAVFFLGNDFKGKEGEQDKTPEEVLALFKYVREKVLEHNPKAHIFCLALTPNASRADVWKEARAANQLIGAYCKTTKNSHYIETEHLYLDENGANRNELFKDDKLHLNRDGYLLWRKVIKESLDSVFAAK